MCVCVTRTHTFILLYRSVIEYSNNTYRNISNVAKSARVQCVTFRSSSFDYLIPVKYHLVKLIFRRIKTVVKIDTTDKKLDGCAKNSKLDISHIYYEIVKLFTNSRGTFSDKIHRILFKLERGLNNDGQINVKLDKHIESEKSFVFSFSRFIH